ncbi:TraV family lipoprotein [Sphingobium sp. H39-3-25]|uniref:TraV family lipoprotein n=1 Tax=Sphingomonadales TaxID=204457 RepID=UPI00082FB8C9|nr:MULTISPECIES: TraV family lipoprotein [Sphingomonadaceae]MDF0491120.1 TraV family lipoprotein [Sphingomonas pollutisoli]MDF0545148.1 TraV family lipoprotein [Sphingobium arseniciresistens]
MPISGLRPPLRVMLALSAIVGLSGCATVGSMMSPYSEKFDCKNKDHGQCIHPEKAYEDAVAGVVSKSDPAVTNDKKMLRGTAAENGGKPAKSGKVVAGGSAYGSYKDSVYRELKGLIDAPVTPMLKPARTVRTLILPYADRQRPDRLYMPRYVYSVVDKPVWVVGGTLVSSPSQASKAPVLGQVKEQAAAPGDTPDAPQPALPEPRP